MRIISGKAKGHKLIAPDEKITRPTSDRTREALFSIIQDEVQESVFLDLFSGSGAVGIEALSRGAASVYLIDVNKTCVDIINENVQKTKLSESAHVINSDAHAFLRDHAKCKFDLIFIDPPYYKDLVLGSLVLIIGKELLADDGIIIIETASDICSDVMKCLENINSLYIYKQKKYGKAILILMKKRKIDGF